MAINETSDQEIQPAVAGKNTANGIGILGDGSASGTGVEGKSQSGKGIIGSSTNGLGIAGYCGNESLFQRGNPENRNSIAVFGRHYEGGVGVFGESFTGEAIHGESNAENSAAISGIQLNPLNTFPAIGAENKGQGWGVFSQTNSINLSAIGAIQLNSESTAPAIYGEAKGKGSAIFGKSQGNEAVHGETNSINSSAITALQLNETSTSAALYVEHKGQGWGILSETNSISLSAIGAIQLNQDPEYTTAALYAESRGAKAPAGYFKGNVWVTGDVSLINGDVAEDFDILNNIEVEDGTVMVLSDNGSVEVSYKAYDKRIAGVISGAGLYKPAVILDKKESHKLRRPIALVGKVYCKVDATLNSIEVGDLLTSSDVPGHAMKVTDPFKGFGTVIGKALKPLTGGKGLIPILVVLQ